MKNNGVLSNFLKSEKSAGILLLIMTLISLALANSQLQHGYAEIRNAEFAGHSLNHWINDGLMAIFFLLIGLELEREIYEGELSNLKNASLPIFAALGGMLVPAATYLVFNLNSTTRSGAGIPMATDIAFALGVLSLLGKRVPVSLKIFLTALAVIDDLGSILVIAIFYSGDLNIANLLVSLGIFAALLVLNKLKVYRLSVYIIGGTAMWYFMLHSGVHATLAGVLLAFAIPFRREGRHSPSFLLHHILEKPVNFIVIPLFALANTAVTFGPGFLRDIAQPYGIGIIFGLVAGKPAGIILFSYISVLAGFAEKPKAVKWSDIAGIGFLGGIGFTMSIFILLLAFDSDLVINSAKAAILIGSLLAGAIGFLWLKIRLRKADQVSS
jgi:NhaA family Na+:H+ antiporter